MDIFMLAALAQSRKALPECLPNPPVGCVIINAQEIVAQGYTQAPGKHHAEADALNQIQGKAFNFLKMYVTLEPCSFHGRTPACALAIAKDRRIHEIRTYALTRKTKYGYGFQALNLDFSTLFRRSLFIKE